MDAPTGDQQDLSMEWNSSPPGSPEKNGNGNVLKRKAEEDVQVGSQAEEDVDMDTETEAPRAQEATVVSNGGEKRTLPQDVLDLTDLPSSPSSPTFPPVAKRAKPGPSSSRATVTASTSTSAKSKSKSKKSTTTATATATAAAGEGEEKKPKPKDKIKGKTRGKGKSDIVKSGIVGLNKKKKLLTLDQTDLAGVVSSYTPFMTLLVQFHDYLFGLTLEGEMPVASSSTSKPNSASASSPTTPAQTSSSTTKKKNKLETLPEAYHPLIVMLGQESALPGSKELARYIKGKIKPAVMGDEESVVEIDLQGLIQTVEELFDQVPYGLQKEDLEQVGLGMEMEIPVTLRLNRWEAKNLDLIPEKEGPAGKGRMGLRDVFEQRRNERKGIKGMVLELVKGLEEGEVGELFGMDLGQGNGDGGNALASGSGSGSGKVNEKQEQVNVAEVEVKEEKKKGKKVDDEVEIMDVDGETAAEVTAEKKKSTRKVKEETEEQRSKREAKEEKAKKKADAEAKAEQQNQKSARMMSSFLSRAPASSPIRGESKRERSASRSSRGSSVQLSDFCADFKPFHQGTNVSLAPVNRFRLHKTIPDQPRGRAGRRDSGSSAAPAKADEELTKEDLLKEMRTQLSSLTFSKTRTAENRMAPMRRTSMSQSRSRDAPRIAKTSEPPLPPPPIVPGLHLKTRYPYWTVDQLITKANETGDGEEARRVYKAFEDKRLYWRKTLKFWEDSRPAYEGTWSKPSLTVGPRTPFAQDNALDYSIDEGIEWEAEDPAEVDLGSALDEDEEPETDDDDEMDDWMVGDDEIEFEEGAEGYTEDKAVPEKKDQRPIEDYYTEVGKAGAVSRNQRFARLVPFQKGPCMETRLGEVDPVMDKYKICMLNDTPMHGIDPFTFTSVPYEPIIVPIKPTFQTTLVGEITKPGSPAPNALKAPPSIPKSPFPAETLGDFLRAIQGAEKNKEAMLQDLFAQFKSATTQKVIRHTFGMVADREKKGSGKWVVKVEAWSQAGLTPPTK